MQILFFGLIPVGIVILVFSIRLLHKNFSGNILIDLPYLQKTGHFVVTKPGNYAIWHKGTYWRRSPLDQFRPVITNESTGETANLIPSIFRPNSNNGRTARMELFRLTLPAGKYKIELTEGSSISRLENAFIRRLPAKMVDFDKYFIQVRESGSFIFVIIGIILCIVAGFCIIGGLVFGILAPQIFKN